MIAVPAAEPVVAEPAATEPEMDETVTAEPQTTRRRSNAGGKHCRIAINHW
ncbi:MAG: hypothetical protein R3C44_17160 [Chloroflexota bacterium]